MEDSGNTPVSGLLNDSTADETETVTAAEVLSKLEEAWLNEKLAPDILEYQTDVVDCMFEQIQEMEENLTRLTKGDFRISVHRLEIERIQYLLTNYFKCRLDKIQKYCATILDVEKNSAINNLPSRLSPEEMLFAKSYYTGVTDHLTDTALQHMPSNMKKFDFLSTMPKPDLSDYVFLRVNHTTQGVFLREDGDERDEVIDLEKGSQHLLPFRTIIHLLKTGAVSLI